MTTTTIANTNTLKITIKALKPDNRGQPYTVSFRGETIITKSHVPSHDACRLLVSLGLSGPLEVWADSEAFPRLLIMDVQKAAQWTVKEGVNHGPRFARYVPFDRFAFMERPERADAEAA
ncbi:hypothetical protein [Rhizobium sp. LjRoot254]|uniref:hypothetical protein n=1 Tax=Rhizobium sp. LjRoot254 TaxID=3342297 RepID=UPI003ECE7045